MTNIRNTKLLPNSVRAENGSNTPIRIGIYAQVVLYGWSFINTNTSDAFAHFYSKNASPTVGTDAPILSLQIPSGQTAVLYGSDPIVQSLYNLYVAFTTSGYLAGNTAPTSNIIYTIFYI